MNTLIYITIIYIYGMAYDGVSDGVRFTCGVYHASNYWYHRFLPLNSVIPKHTASEDVSILCENVEMFRMCERTSTVLVGARTVYRD